MRRTILPVGIFATGMFLSLLLVLNASALTGSFSESQQCYWGLVGGTFEDTGVIPLKEGEVCGKSKVQCEGVEIDKPEPEPALTSYVPRFVAAVAATLAQTGKGEEGYVTSTCKSGKCVATYGCDGKVLAGLPTLPTQPLPPNTTPTPLPPNTTLSPIQTPDIFPSNPPTAPTSNLPPNTTPTPLPTNTSPTPITNPDIRPSPLPSSGSTFPTQRPSVLSPRTGRGGSLDSDGVYSGGNPFYDGSTFGSGSWGSTGGSSANLFSSFFSGLMSFFSGLWGGSGPASGIAASPSSASPKSQDANARAEEIIRQFQQRPDSQAAAKRAEEERQKMVEDALKLGAPIPPQSADRTGLPAPGEKSLDELLREDAIRASNPNRIPLEVIQDEERSLNPSAPPGPSGENTSGVQVVENDDTKNDESPPLPPHPDWWPPGIESTFAQGIEGGLSPFDARRHAEERFVDGVLDGLAKGSLAPGSTDVETARRILQEEVSRAERVRDNSYFTSVSGDFYEWFDKNITPLTSEARAVRDARVRLALLGRTEATAQLAAEAGGEPQPYRIVIFGSPDARPFDMTGGKEIDFFDVPTILAGKAFSAVKSWWTGPTAAAMPTSPPPASGLLSGLSAMAKRAYDATYGVARRLGFTSEVPEVSFPPSTPLPAIVPTPAAPAPPRSAPAPTLSPTPEGPSVPPSPPADPLPPAPPSVPKTPAAPPPAPHTPPAAPTPPPTPAAPPPSAPTPSTPTPSGGQSSSFLQGGISLLSGIWQSLLGFFTGSDSNDENTPSQPAPTPVANPSASITANPAILDAGQSTQLAWSSVGSSQCALVDSLLNVIARGTSGDVSSPALEASARFGVICDIAGGRDKFVNETLVRVRGDDTDPAPLFSQSGPVSLPPPVSASTSGIDAGADDADAALQPIDVRTCDPEQSMDSFIRCLCEAEPNPNGCTIPPGGL